MLMFLARNSMLGCRDMIAQLVNNPDLEREPLS